MKFRVLVVFITLFGFINLALAEEPTKEERLEFISALEKIISTTPKEDGSVIINSPREELSKYPHS